MLANRKIGGNLELIINKERHFIGAVCCLLFAQCLLLDRVFCALQLVANYSQVSAGVQ
jgi:hypothetical protein